MRIPLSQAPRQVDDLLDFMTSAPVEAGAWLLVYDGQHWRKALVLGVEEGRAKVQYNDDNSQGQVQVSGPARVSVLVARKHGKRGRG